MHAGEVILLGIAPCDKDTEWSAQPCQLIRKGLLVQRDISKEAASTEEPEESGIAVDSPEKEHRETICRSKCALILGNTIWAKQAQLLEKLRSHDIDADGVITYHYASSWTPIFEAKERLLRKNLAVENPCHISDLLDICVTARLPKEVITKLSLFSVPTKEINVPQTADNSKNTSNQLENIPHSSSNDVQVEAVPKLQFIACSQAIKIMYQGAKSDIIQNHQKAHLNPDPELEELSDTGLPKEKDLERHSQNSNIPPSELLMKLRTLKLKNKIEMSDDNLVVITYVYDPEHFYVRHAKFSRQLSSLEKEITTYAEQAKILHSSSKFEFVEGRICIGRQLSAPVLNDINITEAVRDVHSGKDFFEYKRVQILRYATKEDFAWERDPMGNFRYLDSGDENDNGYSSEEDLCIKTSMFTVFFVDYGYQKVMSVHDLMPIPKIFVENLPLQAIECSLSNIQPAIENVQDMVYWSAEAIEEMNNYATIKDTFVEGDRHLVKNKSPIQFRAQSVTKFANDPDVISETCHVPVGYWVKLVPRNGGDHLGMKLIKSGLAINVYEEDAMLSYEGDELKNFNSSKELETTDPNIMASNKCDAFNKINIEVGQNNLITTSERSLLQTNPIQPNNVAKVIPLQKEAAKALQYKNLVLPPALPGLCIDENSGNGTSVNIMPRLVTWSQNKSKTNVTFRLELDLKYAQETCINNAFLSVQSRSLAFEYLDVGHIQDGLEDYRHHKIPTVDLYGAVDPQRTEVKFSGKQVVVRLTKAHTCFWKQAAIDAASGKPKKLFWIKLDNELGWHGSTNASDTDTDSEIKVSGPENHKRKLQSRTAAKIRETLDRYPKPSPFNEKARNFDDSTDGIDEFDALSDGSNNVDSDSDDIDGMLFK